MILDSLRILTTNDKWESEFFDRTTKNKSQIHKILELKELDFYWNE